MINKPKKYFGVYFSAYEHTHKLKLPKSLFLIPILLITIIGAVYLGLSTLRKDADISTEPYIEENESLLPTALSTARDHQPLSLDDYIKERTPRLAGLKHTAPVYDPLTKPRSFPKPQNCVLWNKDTKKEVCICYSQRITRMDVPDYLVPFHGQERVLR